jgi:ketosteroid isomerase-like protein
MPKIIAFLAIGLALLTSCAPKPGITQTELMRRTQELFNSVAAGDQTPWKKYFADDCLYFDEKGRKMDKVALLADLTPMPAGYSGTITLAAAQSHIEGDIAIMSYDLDETETIFGQNMTARYHETDTWMRRNGQWQIIAGQVLRYYEDPAAGTVDVSRLAKYAGTYELTAGNTLTISSDGKALYRRRGEHPSEILIPEAGDIFFRKGVEGRILFRFGADGKVSTLIDRRNNEDVVWKKIK